MGPPSTDDILRWLFTCPSSKEELKVWSDGEILRKDQENKLHQFLHKNGCTLKTQCMKKRNQLNYKEALEAIWDLLVKELVERKFGTNYAPRSFESILQKKLEELIEGQNGISKIMVDVVQNVLNKPRSIDFRCEPALTAVAADDWGLGTFEEGDLRIHSSLDNADTCIKEEIKSCSKKIDLKLVESDSLMMHTLQERANLLNKVNPFASGDYETILVPLVKPYILV
ncbi:Ubiquitin carboxyl-terminal hydrolase-related protein [Thalictrum thalictroides]|uniref:Ubiquitin carboxyl-terminal hydrolase-related protein n=1 Tax=Thalictrum thalictroides TaxID=46969 RepID=A0A7J6USR4_THATH|nr:Ubiquitin carboxyl-terminal hydrolase-related protein [Thalictrum thalictroides]